MIIIEQAVIVNTGVKIDFRVDRLVDSYLSSVLATFLSDLRSRLCFFLVHSRAPEFLFETVLRLSNY